VTVHSHTPARFTRRSIYGSFTAISFACLLGTLLTDVVYARTAAMQWANISAWLLTIGLFVAIPAVILGLIDFLDRRVRAIAAAWVHGITAGLALALSILNAFVHSRDAYSSVVPDGLILSAIVAVLTLISAAAGWRVAYRYGVGLYSEHAA
jgi:uncharacterized membrane protein